MARNSQDNLKKLGETFPGSDLISIPPNENQRKVIDCDHPWDKHDLGPYGCVTAYGQVHQGPAPSGIVRFNLFAELMGVKSLVASAFVTMAQRGGLLMTATGIVADSWTLKAQASADTISVKAGLISSRGCAAPSVRVPARFRNVPEFTPPNMTTGSPNPGPLETGTGQTEIYSLENPGPADEIQLAPGERVVSIQANSNLGAGSFDVRFPDDIPRTVNIGVVFFADLLGESLSGVLFTGFDSVTAITVITVR